MAKSPNFVFFTLVRLYTGYFTLKTQNKLQKRFGDKAYDVFFDNFNLHIGTRLAVFDFCSDSGKGNAKTSNDAR